MRQIVLDTETTGLEPSRGHRIIEIGCVELVNRRPTGNHYHQYINPEREIDQGAIEVHGITNEYLKDKPVFSEVIEDFVGFIKGAQLVIHNAPFDVGFINHELRLFNKSHPAVDSFCSVLDTLTMAREKHPGQKNNLDALCKRYSIDNSRREKHGALLDAEILADVYLAMTGGQVDLMFREEESRQAGMKKTSRKLAIPGMERIPVIVASQEEVLAHEKRLSEIDKASNGQCVWPFAGETGEMATTD